MSIHTRGHTVCIKCQPWQPFSYPTAQLITSLVHRAFEVSGQIHIIQATVLDSFWGSAPNQVRRSTIHRNHYLFKQQHFLCKRQIFTPFELVFDLCTSDTSPLPPLIQTSVVMFMYKNETHGHSMMCINIIWGKPGVLCLGPLQSENQCL